MGTDDKAEGGDAFMNTGDVRLLLVDRQLKVLFKYPFDNLPASFRLPLITCKDQDVAGVGYDPYSHALHLLIKGVRKGVA